MKVTSFIKNPIVERAYKTFIEITAAQAALYGTVVPDSPGVKASAVISTSATVLSVVWNGALLWFTNTRSAKLDRLAQAIDTIVDKRIAEQAAEQKEAPAPVVGQA